MTATGVIRWWAGNALTVRNKILAVPVREQLVAKLPTALVGASSLPATRVRFGGIKDTDQEVANLVQVDCEGDCPTCSPSIWPPQPAPGTRSSTV